MLDSAFSVWIIFRPETHKLIKMVGAEYGPVSSEVIKVVHDDGHEEVEDEEAADDEEANEVDVGDVITTTLSIGV